MTNTEATVRSDYRFLDGTWVNQLGSEVTFTADALGGLRGEYCGGAGALAGHRYPIIGSFQPDPLAGNVPVAFMVRWSEAHCLTTWCGHYLADGEEIHTTWLMSSEGEQGDEWKSTLIGHDVFRRRA